MGSMIDARRRMRAVAALAATALALTLLPGVAFATDVTVDGVDYDTDAAAGTALCTGPFSYDGDPLLALPDEVRDGSRSFPVVGVRDAAFQGNSVIERFVSPARLASIGAGAFSASTSLRSVDLSASSAMTALGGADGTGSSCFASCTSLQEVRLPDGLRVIGPNAFYLCVDLFQIDLPDTLETIGASAFEATRLTNVTVPASVAEIGSLAFASCTVLESITCLGTDVVPALHGQALYQSTALDAVYVPVGMKQAYVAKGWPERLVKEVRPGRLSDLSVRDGAADFPLMPAFDPDAEKQDYAVTLDEETESFAVVPVGGAPDDVITVNGVRVESGDASPRIPVARDSDVEVRVEIGGAQGTRTYTVKATRPAAALVSVAVESQPAKLAYHAGEALDLSGMTLRLYWTDATSTLVTADAVGVACEPANGAALTEADDGKAVKVSYRGKSAETDALSVGPAVVTSATVAAQPQLAYHEGEALNLSGLRVSLGWSDGARTVVGADAAGLACNPADGTVLAAADDGTPVTAVYGGVTVPVGTLAVSSANIASIAVVQQPAKLSYHAGEPLDLSGLRLKLTWEDGTSNEVGHDQAGIACDPAHGLPLDASYDGAGVTVAFRDKGARTEPLTVGPALLQSVAVKAQPRLSYHAGDGLDLSGLRLSLGWSDGSRTEIDATAAGIACDPADGAVLSEADSGKALTATYRGIAARVGALEVNPALMKSVVVKTQPRLTYREGEPLDLSGMALTLTWADGMVMDVGADLVGLACDPADGEALGAFHDGRAVSATYAGRTGRTEALSVAVSPAPKLSAIAIETQPRLAYRFGEKLDLSGMVVSLTWDDGSVTKGDAGLVGLACDPADGTVLDGSFDGKAVTVVYEGLSARTEPLSVKGGGKPMPPTGDPLSGMVPLGLALAAVALAGAVAVALRRGPAR